MLVMKIVKTLIKTCDIMNLINAWLRLATVLNTRWLTYIKNPFQTFTNQDLCPRFIVQLTSLCQEPSMISQKPYKENVRVKDPKLYWDSGGFGLMAARASVKNAQNLSDKVNGEK